MMLRVLHMVMIAHLHSEVYSQCSPAEEGKLYVIQGKLNHTVPKNLELLWKRKDTPVSTCKSNLRCTDNNNKTTITSINSDNSYEYHFQLRILSITRRDSNEWSLKYLGSASLAHSEPLFVCNLKIFAKGVNASCEETIQNEILKVQCRIFNVYPAAKSFLFVKTVTESPTPSEMLMNCANSLTGKDISIYFMAVCEAEISVKKLQHWGGGFVTIYPNITGDREDRKFGVNITLTKYTNQSVLTLKNCPQVVLEGTQINCLCTTKYTSTTDNNQTWLDVGSKNSMANGPVLSFVAAINSSGYVCRGSNILGVSNIPVYYRPTVISKVDNLKCATHIDQVQIQIICKVFRMYPQGTCQAIVQRDKMDYINENYQMSTKNMFNSNELYYLTQCTLNFPNDQFLHGNYSVTIIVYPNATGNGSDKLYGVNQTVNVNFPERKLSPLSSAGEGTETSTDFQSLIGPISLGAVALILVVILTSLIVCYKKKICLQNVLSQVFIVGNINKTRTASGNISHIYESVENLDASSDSQPEKTYVNGEAVAARLQLLDNDYITPRETKIIFQKTSHSNNTQILFSFNNHQ